jgi:hypothetical protein
MRRGGASGASHARHVQECVLRERHERDSEQVAVTNGQAGAGRFARGCRGRGTDIGSRCSRVLFGNAIALRSRACVGTSRYQGGRIEAAFFMHPARSSRLHPAR